MSGQQHLQNLPNRQKKKHLQPEEQLHLQNKHKKLSGNHPQGCKLPQCEGRVLHALELYLALLR